MKSITIVIPSFNSKKYIKRCVESVLAQEYPLLSIVAADNESTDGTYEYLLSLKDPRLKVVSLPNTIPNGYREAIEYIFQNAETDYITFVCSDDFVAPFYAQKCMKTIEKTDALCMQSSMITVNENEQSNGIMGHSYINMEDFKKQFLVRSPVNNPTVVYHKNLWPLIKDGREAHHHHNLPDLGAGDYDLWGKFADNEIYIHPASAFMGYYYRWHPGQATWTIKKQDVNYDKIIQDYWRAKWKM